VSKNNIFDIIYYNLNKNYLILLIFGTNIFGTTGHQMAGHVLISLIVCFCITWEIWVNKICVEMDINTPKAFSTTTLSIVT